MLILLLCALAIGPVVAAPADGLSPSGDTPIAIRMGQPFYSGAILPTPAEANYREELLELADGPNGRWLCSLTFEDAGPVRELMLRLIRNRFKAYAEQFAEMPAMPQAPGGVALRFVLVDERARASSTGLAALLPKVSRLPEQGYLLEVSPDGASCLARDNAGLVNGLASLLQLVHVRDGKLVARCASVRDWPTFTTRYTSEYHVPGPDFFDWMMLYKINGFAACYPGMRWEGLDEPRRRALKAVGDYALRYRTLSFMIQLHIGGRAGRPVDCADPADVERLCRTIAETMRLSRPRHVMICYDDVVVELQPMERQRFARPALAHCAAMRQVVATVKQADPAAVVSFCPPHYQGLQHPRWRETNPGLADALQYMADLRANLPAEVRLVWTGPVTESRWITAQDIAGYRELIGPDRGLLYWDNTWHYHQPLRNFHAQYPPGFVDFCADRTGYININGTRPIGKFFAVTANDYYWNPDGFESVRSRKQAIAQFMGQRAVPIAERLWALRGEDYMDFFARDVDLGALGRVTDDLAAVSLDPGLTQVCRDTYEEIAKQRAPRG